MLNSEYFRGDTIPFIFDLKDEDGKNIKYKSGDVVLFGIKTSLYKDEYGLFRRIEITEDTDVIKIKFPPEETKNLDTTEYIVELKLIRDGDTQTIYQESKRIKGEVIRNVPQNDSNS